MRLLVCLLSIVALAAPAAFAGTAVPVNPVWNPGFEAYVPGGAVLLKDTPADRTYGVGRQVLGCGHLANAIWQSGCDKKPRDPATEIQAIVANPNDELEYWTRDGYERGDLVALNPARTNTFYAQNWNHFPFGSVEFRDLGDNLDREAVVVADSHLYQTGLATSTHSAVPMGLVRDVTFKLEAGATGGRFTFVLDSFPLESAADYPQMFYNYQLSVPATAWAVAADGTVTIDPTKGSLSFHAGYILPSADPHPTVAEWDAATPEERRAMLMEFRAIQISFWSLPVGAVIDDVSMNVEA